jgi:zinc protease
MSRRSLVVAAALLLGVAAAPLAPRPALAGDLDLPAQERTLGNGLKVIVLEDHTIPNCSLHIWWRVGARNERTGITGLAHFFEHMMFIGGKQYGASFDPTMESLGGDNNAWTSHDVTVYHERFPKAALATILDMERDRMSGMAFTPENVEHERDVVHGEYRKGMEDPSSRMGELLRATAYTTHPYHWDVIGWEADILGWKQEDLEAFYAENYAPNNATLVLVGDVTAAEGFAAVEKAMGAVPRKPERRPLHSREPEQKGERRVVLEDPSAMLPQVALAWHIGSTLDEEFPVQEVIEDLLVDGDASRLQKQLVEDEQLCLGVGGGWQGHQFDPSLFTLELVMREDADTATGEARVYAAFERLAKEGPTERELRRVKNKNRAELVRRLATIDGKAEVLGETETFFGGWRNVAKRVERIEAVTAEDVKRVVAKTFTARNRTACTLVNPAKARAPAAPPEEPARAPKDGGQSEEGAPPAPEKEGR